MSNGFDDPFPLPPIFPRPRPGPTLPDFFPFPTFPTFPDDDRLPPLRPPIITALPLPVPTFPGGQGFPIPTGDVLQLPRAPANEPFGGRAIRIGRIIRGIGLGTIIIIATEILIDQIEKRQLRKIGEIIERQDAEIAQSQIDRLEERRRIKEITIEPGKFPLPQIGGAEIPAPKPFTAPRKPTPIERPATLPFPRFPDIFPPFPAPEPFEIPAPRPIIEPELPPLASPGQIPRPLTTPAGQPFALPGRRPVFFPISPPAATPRPRFAPIGDIPFGQPLTPVGPGVGEFGFIDPAPGPSTQPRTASQRCETVKRRRRRKGKCREGFFIERPGATEFITWREKECDTSGAIAKGRRALEIVKG